MPRETRTTIQVDGTTLLMLEHLKRSRGVKSYSVLIRGLIRESKRLRRSEMGRFPKLKEFRREKRDRFD